MCELAYSLTGTISLRSFLPKLLGLLTWLMCIQRMKQSITFATWGLQGLYLKCNSAVKRGNFKDILGYVVILDYVGDQMWSVGRLWANEGKRSKKSFVLLICFSCLFNQGWFRTVLWSLTRWWGKTCIPKRGLHGLWWIHCDFLCRSVCTAPWVPNTWG